MRGILRGSHEATRALRSWLFDNFCEKDTVGTLTGFQTLSALQSAKIVKEPRFLTNCLRAFVSLWQFQITAPIYFFLIFLICSCDSTTESQKTTAQTFDLEQNTSQDPRVQIRSLSKQILSSPENYALYEERSRMYYQLDRLDSALIDIDQAIDLFRNGPELHYLKGFYAYMVDDTATAREELLAAIGLGSTNPESFYQLGQLYFIQGKEAYALEAYQKALEMDSTQAVYYLAKGLVYEKQRAFNQAEAAYLRALKADPDFIKAMTQLHNLYLNVFQDEQRALTYTQRLLQVDPTHPLGKYQEGNYYLRKALAITDEQQENQFRQAINDAVTSFTVAINKDPDFIPAIYSRGYCYFMGSELEPAVADFRRILEINPQHAQSHFMLGSISEYYQDLDKALEHYQQVLATEPNNADAQRAIEEIQAKKP